jgi:hypothetical protein
MFNFGISTESAVKTSKPQLKPYEIHDVEFIGCEIVEGVSKNDPSKEWKRMDIKFENENGYFNVPLWFPKEGDNKRPEYPAKNGGTVVYPSSFELLMATVAQTGQILNPEGFAKMQAISSKFKNFDDVAEALKKVLDKVKGTKTKLKLVATVKQQTGEVNVHIPKILGINKQGESFISDNYIGDKLFFSKYEEDRMKDFHASKPAKVEQQKSEDLLTEVGSSEDELNLDDLLKE